MALFKILSGQQASLGDSSSDNSKLTHEGWAYFAKDTGNFYIDIRSDEAPVIGSNRIQLNAGKAVGANLSTNTYGITYFSDALGTFASTTAGAAEYLLQGNGVSGPPSWIQATNENIVSTIIKRDSTGSFNAKSINLTGQLSLNTGQKGAADAISLQGWHGSYTGAQSVPQGSINVNPGAANIEGLTTLVLGNARKKVEENNTSGVITLYNINGTSVNLISKYGTLTGLSGSKNYLEIDNYVKGTFIGNITGKATTAGTADNADQLTTARQINGTDFDGSSDITTTVWGYARQITIADNTVTNSVAHTVDGGSNVTLKLPATIKATLKGNADTATSLVTSVSVGDAYSPVYFNQGLPAEVSVVQKAAFTIPSAATTATVTWTNAYRENTMVLAIVVTSGQANLNGPINWSSATGKVTLTTTATSGAVSGYILTARGVELATAI